MAGHRISEKEDYTQTEYVQDKSKQTNANTPTFYFICISRYI